MCSSVGLLVVNTRLAVVLFQKSDGKFTDQIGLGQRTVSFIPLPQKQTRDIVTGIKTWWCAREDLNLQSFRNQILSLARLPFRHARAQGQDARHCAETQEHLSGEHSV